MTAGRQCLPSQYILICQGHTPLVALLPRTILCLGSVTLTPHSAGSEKSNKQTKGNKFSVDRVLFIFGRAPLAFTVFTDWSYFKNWESMTDVDEPRNEQEGERATVADMKNQCYICIWPLTERLLNVYCNAMEVGGGGGKGGCHCSKKKRIRSHLFASR